MKPYIFTLQSLSDTQEFGFLLGSLAKPGFIYCLNGDLGAGKTTLTQAIASGLKLTDGDYISSPSFAIMHEYHGEIPLYHMDFYRLHGADDVIELGFDEYFFKKGLTVIEWSKRATEILPEELLTIDIEITTNEVRIVTLHPAPLYLPLVQEISRKYKSS